MEHENSQKSIGYTLFMKAGRQQCTVRIPQKLELTFEQFKDILEEYQLTLSWWDMFGFFTMKKHIGCSFSIQSILENGMIPCGHGSDKGRQTVFITPLNLFGRDSDEEELRDVFSVLRKCTTTVIDNEIRMPFGG